MSNLPTDAILVDASTISPSMSAEIDDAVPRYVALPILGAPQAVRSGDAIYLAGGSDELIDSLGPLLDTLGGDYKRYERPSFACAGKLAVNLLLLSGIVTLAEAIEVGRSGGLDDEEAPATFCARRRCWLLVCSTASKVIVDKVVAWSAAPFAEKGACRARDRLLYLGDTEAAPFGSALIGTGGIGTLARTVRPLGARGPWSTRRRGGRSARTRSGPRSKRARETRSNSGGLGQR